MGKLLLQPAAASHYNPAPYWPIRGSAARCLFGGCPVHGLAGKRLIVRQLYPMLWLATLGLAAASLLRPGGLGTLIAVAANWEDVPWSDTFRSPAPRATTVPQGPSGPSGPFTNSRPTAWPGEASRARDGVVEERRGVEPLPEAPQPNGLRFSAPPPPPNDQQRYPETNPDASNPAPAQRPAGIDPFAEEPDLPAVAPAVPSGPSGPQAANVIPCEGAEMLARVGSEVILAKELSMGIAELRAKNPNVPPEAMEAEIRKILKQRLDQKIEEKLIYLDAKRTLPPDNFPKILDNVAREFENLQVPRLMKGTNARTRQEMEKALEAAGTSLEMQKRNFVEQVLAQEWLRQQTKVEEEINLSHDDALTYYREHRADYEKPARARWEQLTVKVSRFRSREEAYAALAQMGNQVLNGVPLAEVAKAQSHGVTARDGGRWDWTTQGSLASKALDRMIFGEGNRPGLPVGALSPILEEDQAFHIVRVTEREPSGCVPFHDAQAGIKKKIHADREAKAKRDYLAKIRRETPVWTVFDESATAERPRDRWMR